MTDSLSIKTVWIRLCALKELPTDKAAGFRINGQRMILARCGDTVRVFQGFCSHMLYPLADSKIRDCEITCSLHRSKFKVEDGTVVEWATLQAGSGETVDAIRAQHTLKIFSTRVENGDIFLEWPADNADAVRVKLDFRLVR